MLSIILLWLWTTEEKLKGYDELLKSFEGSVGGGAHFSDSLSQIDPVVPLTFDLTENCVFAVDNISASSFHSPDYVGSNI